MKNKVIKIPAPNAFGNFPVWFAPKGSFVIAKVRSTFFERLHRKRERKLIGQIICWLIGHPQSGNIFIVGTNTYCARCGRLNIS